jgi:cell fate regulator YaaT (PSP1 superfamily)
MNGAAAGVTVPPPAPPPLVRVTFAPGTVGHVCQQAGTTAARSGEWYVIRTDDGERLGRIASFELPVFRPTAGRPAGTVVRPASAAEIEAGRRLAGIERDAMQLCRQRARELRLEIRPVSALVPLDRDVVILTFAAEERTDLKELVRTLSRQLRRRVELRQVGVRDQAKSAGGWGPCGRTLCCSTHMTRFASISIRMAKAQNLSLNPARISGMCGRLMCCLSHEAPAGAAKPRPPRES